MDKLKLKNGFNLIIVGCLSIAALIVFTVSFFTTIYYDMNIDVDFPQYGKENIPLLIIFSVVVMFLFYKIYRRDKNILSGKGTFVFALCFCFCYCMMLILAIKPRPVNDSMTLNRIINDFMDGDYSQLTTPGGYLFYWPYQLGYVAFGQIMCTIFGKDNFFAWDICQLISIMTTLFLLHRITWEIFEEKVICGLMDILSAGCLFFYNYVTYVYGDILSMGPQTLALYLTLLYIKREKKRYIAGAALSIAFAVMLKSNAQIALIAMSMLIIGSVIKAGRDFDRSTLLKRLIERVLMVVMLVLAVKSVGFAVNSYYRNVTGLTELPDGCPLESYIAMGLQESELEDGWYNGYHYTIYGKFNDYDADAARTMARENIAETLKSFISNPLHGGRYLLRKFTTQWADSVCISTHNLDLVSRHVENPTKMMYYLVFGDGSKILIWVMNVFMTICYLCICVCLFRILKDKKVSSSAMLFLILIFGGIVFHEFWEGTSRYAMRYYIYWLPFAAAGLKIILDAIETKIHGA
ncbi:MAG: glycosyltransferase family 39 protein [Butyrivibrio sp.]|nr:glycosyltransferase family 39 protein [Butyrivibrio sp.]